MWFIYILRCRDRSLYTGVTTDVARRVGEHQAGGAKAAKYVRSKLPVELVFQAEIGPKVKAYQVEAAIKQLSKPQKERLVRGELSIDTVLEKMKGFVLRPIVADDRLEIGERLAESWGEPVLVSKGIMHQADQLPGFVAVAGRKLEKIVGILTYHIEAGACEVVTIDSFLPKKGVGQALLAEVEQAAKVAGCHRLWLITTNDNVDALKFYQRAGFQIAAVYPNAIEASRKLKPTIPETGLYGIPIRDEIELEKAISTGSNNKGSAK